MASTSISCIFIGDQFNLRQVIACFACDAVQNLERKMMFRNIRLIELFPFVAIVTAMTVLSYSGSCQGVQDSASISVPVIVFAKTYTKGIYMSFEEFKTNNPTLKGEFGFSPRRVWLTDPSSGKKVKIKKAWGFSDGRRVYAPWHKYNPLEVIDRYCYFDERGTRLVWGFSAFPPMIMPFPMPYRVQAVINLNNGKTYPLNKKVMRTILADDPELLKRFNKESGKKQKFKEYIVLYNNAHKSQLHQ